MSDSNTVSLFPRLFRLVLAPLILLSHTMLSVIGASSSSDPAAAATGSTSNGDSGIMAFRTGSVFLSHLHQLNMEKLPDIKFGKRTPQRLEMKLYRAIATIAVMDIDVITFTSNATFHGLKGKSSSESLQSLSRGDGPDNAPTAVVMAGKEAGTGAGQTSRSLTSHGLQFVQNCFVAINNYLRRDAADHNPSETSPRFMETQRPDVINSDSDADFIQFLNNYPSNIPYGRQFKLEEHLWVIHRFLIIKDDILPQKHTHFLRYVIPTCVAKIYRRLRWTSWSKTYLKKIRQEHNKGQYTPPRSSDRLPDHELRNQKDFTLLMEIVLDGDQPRKFADRRLALRDEDATDHISITRIVAKAMHLKSLSISAADSKQTQLYDETTHDEIGRFWLYLLDQLAYALGTTQYYRGIRPESPGGRLVELDPKDKRTMDQAINDAVFLSTALWQLSQGNALAQYLQSMESLLCLDPLTGDESQGPEVERDNDPEVEQDDDQDTNQKDQGKPTWKRYLTWTDLVSSHIKGIYTLCRYFAQDSSHDISILPISMRILVCPPVDSKMMTWSGLILSDYFPGPAITNWNTQTDAVNLGVYTNKDIYDILKAAADVYSKDFVDELCYKQRRSQAKLKFLAESLEKLQKCQIATLVDLADIARGKIIPNNKNYYSADATELATSLKPFNTWTKFFKFLNGEDAVAVANNIRHDFKGTIHSEACLTSLMHHEVLESNRFPDLFPILSSLSNIIGVSKRCCPMCRNLVGLLVTGPQGARAHFVVDASHENFTPYDIPPWLPPSIVNSMNTIFMAHLRKEILWFISRHIGVDARSTSPDSTNLSDLGSLSD